MIRPSTPGDVVELHSQLSDADVREIKDVSGLEPANALAMGLFHSDQCMSAVDDEGAVLAMFGVSDQLCGVGCVWLLSSPRIKELKRKGLAVARLWVNEQHQKYDSLENVMDARNMAHQVLLEHLGFSFGEPLHNYGPGRVTVIPIERKA